MYMKTGNPMNLMHQSFHQLSLGDSVQLSRAMSTNRWVVNIANEWRVKSTLESVLNLKPNSVYSAFDMLMSILKHQTAKLIFVEANFSVEQFNQIKQAARFSGTEICLVQNPKDIETYNSDQALIA